LWGDFNKPHRSKRRPVEVATPATCEVFFNLNRSECIKTLNYTIVNWVFVKERERPAVHGYFFALPQMFEMYQN
jgi:hypothetical protein